jgi:hypothetical protein
LSRSTPSFFAYCRVERVLGVDERRHPAELLRLGDDVQRQRRLARRFGPEDLDHPAAGHAADAERVVEAHRAGGNGRDRRDGVLLAQAHDRALAELFLDLPQGDFDGLGALAVVSVFCCHVTPCGCSPPASAGTMEGRPRLT